MFKLNFHGLIDETIKKWGLMNGRNFILYQNHRFGHNFWFRSIFSIWKSGNFCWDSKNRICLELGACWFLQNFNFFSNIALQKICPRSLTFATTNQNQNKIGLNNVSHKNQIAPSSQHWSTFTMMKNFSCSKLQFIVVCELIIGL